MLRAQRGLRDTSGRRRTATHPSCLPGRVSVNVSGRVSSNVSLPLIRVSVRRFLFFSWSSLLCSFVVLWVRAPGGGGGTSKDRDLDALPTFGVWNDVAYAVTMASPLHDGDAADNEEGRVAASMSRWLSRSGSG